MADGKIPADRMELMRQETFQASENVDAGDLIENYFTGWCRKARNFTPILGTSPGINYCTGSQPGVKVGELSMVQFFTNSSTNYLTAVFGTITGGYNFTMGTQLVVSTYTAQKIIGVCLIDATHVLAVYYSGASSISAVVITISGSTLSLGTPIVVASATSSQIDVKLVNPTYAVVAYVDEGNHYAYGCAINISGTTLYSGGLLVIEGASCQSAIFNNRAISLAVVDSTHVVATYIGPYTPATWMKCTMITVVTTGTYLSLTGSSVTWNPCTNIGAIASVRIDNLRLIVLWCNQVNLNTALNMQIIMLSGYALTSPGTNIILSPQVIYDLCMEVVDSQKLYITFIGTGGIYGVYVVTHTSTNSEALMGTIQLLPVASAKLFNVRLSGGFNIVPSAGCTYIYSARLNAHGFAKAAIPTSLTGIVYTW